MHVLQSRVLLRPSDLDASVAFYEHRIGLVRYREWGHAPHRGVVYFLGGGYLELSENANGPTPDPGVRLWLQVVDARAAREELAAKGVAIAAEPERKPWGLIELSVHDPDGLELVIVETPIDHPLRRRE
ncbi:MAG TPA: VOC family protein [Egibacteraceae bacterium]|jgi:catechol 2,3-dioxygenase-like lactoylglutathione lyase family enzyme|nr:VOC family protein [Egibacteraceae bacterium]